jgi:phosphatidate cytidylyltransferase
MGGIGKKKIWTGVVIVPPLILLLVWGPSFILPLVILVATFLGLREFYHLALPGSKRLERFVGIGLGMMLTVVASCGRPGTASLSVVFILLVLSVLFMGTSQDLALATIHLGISFFGVLYIGFLLSHVVMIQSLPGGKRWALFLISTVWAGDTCALVGGLLFGRHKLYPKISPKKTYEGLIGGVLGSIVVALVFGWLFLPGVGKPVLAFLAAGIGIFGQFGDFSESMIKRSAQVKDSSNLIPGHGGMLDRLDSFLFSSPFLYYSLIYVLKETP